ncbi:MAG: DUF1080 domain-containing protein [Planctomycetaceae bacterium]|nr:DUF1080 domain-containing protein [Planctomycetaceae bacterium]
MSFIRTVAVLFLCSTSFSFGGMANAAEEDFRPLLNGRNLEGWVLVNTPAETWSVQDEMLICTGKPIGEIRTERMYQNFVMEVEWRHMVPGGNAGIFVWADDITARGVPFHRGVEVQVLENAYGQSPHHTTHGDIFPIHGAKMTPVNGRGGSRAFPTEERSKPSPEWNHYRIECNDGRISLAVNGKVVTKGYDASPRKGYICIESEGGVVHYRNMKIRELPDTPVDPDDVAVSNRGFHSFYSGLNLNNWKTNEDNLRHWHVKDWVLSYDGKAESVDGKTLTSRETIRDRVFLFDMKPGMGFDGVAICGAMLPTRLTNPGEWYRLEVTIRNEAMAIRINGEEVTSDNPVAESLPFSLYVVGPADFANFYVRESR